MPAADFLPIAQPATRPDIVDARKPASESKEAGPKKTGKDSFAEILETEAKPETETNPSSSPTNASPASASSSPGKKLSQINNASAIAEILVFQGPVALEPGVEVPKSKPAAQPAEGALVGFTVKPETAPGLAAAAPPTSRVPAFANAITASSKDPIPKDALMNAASAAAAPDSGSPPGFSNIAVNLSKAIPNPAANAATHLNSNSAPAERSGLEDGASDAGDDAPPDPAASAHGSNSPEPNNANATLLAAPAIVAAAPASEIATGVVAIVAGGQAAPPKLAAPATPAQNAPGQRRKAAADAVASTPDANASQLKAAAQQAKGGASPIQPANGQAKSPGLVAAAADAATPDIKADSPSPASSAAPISPDGQLSFADALSGARGQADTGRAQAANPQLQSAPSAAVQVYARFIERFDGRAQRFEVRLDPAGLGRVDVRIEVGADKKVHAILAAHDSAALTDLMRGQRSLERALSDAGVDLADNGLRFELSQDAGRNLSGQQRGDHWSNDELAHAWRGFSLVDVPVEASAADAASISRRFSRRWSRLDLVA